MDWNVNRWFVLSLLLLFTTSYSAQDSESLEVDSIWWEQKIDELNYEEDKEEFEPINREGKSPNISWLFSREVTYTILFIIIVILLILFYKLYLKGLLESTNEREERTYKYFDEEDLDEHFYEMDLPHLLDSSLKSNDWKMAIRIQYLILLKKLIDERRISWHRNLTNLQISRQLANKAAETALKEIILSVELFWYGDEKAESEDYRLFQERVISFSINEKEVGDER